MTPSEQIDLYIKNLDGWQGEMMAEIRNLIHEADPGITEEWKWSTPVFSQKGNVCALGVFKDHIKINFFQGAKISDPKKLFNAGLDAKNTRAIDFHEGEPLDEPALKDLIRSAVEHNRNK